MTKRFPLLSAAVLLFLPSLAAAAATAPPCRDLEPHLQAGAGAVQAVSAETGRPGFKVFREAVAASLRQAGDAAAAGRVDALVADRPVPAEESALASCLLRRYTVARYGAWLTRDLQQMVAFRTFAEE